MCLTEVTSRVSGVLVPAALEVGEAFVPVISTVCPTCSLNLEVSPLSW